MKKNILAGAVIVLIVGLISGNAPAQQKSADAKKTEAAQAAVPSDAVADLSNVSGTVNVTKDKKTAEVTELELLTQSGFKFKITRDAESKYLESKNGETVEISGLISQKDGQKWVTIKKPVALSAVDDKAAEGKTTRKNTEKKEQREKKPPRKFKFDY